MKPIGKDISDFETLRKAGQIYVDKTAYLHSLVTDPECTFFFCARPRRFGKSLSVTTFKSIFLGHREWFDGLAISKTNYDWKPHPVIHFNWGGVNCESLKMFEETLAGTVRDTLIAAGYEYDGSVPPSLNLARAIRFFHEKDPDRGCVILIDEYDDPVAKSLKDLTLAEKIRDRLASIYAQFKDNSDKIRFLYITGVSKFTKLSVFSALSSLNDISFDAKYAALYGYTDDELTEYFEEHMRLKATRMGLSDAEFRDALKYWYNGYRFAKFNSVTVYNPVSIGLMLASEDPEFAANWAQTGKASMLMNYLRREELLNLDYENLEGVGENMFDVSQLDKINPIGMLYQAGYLTIKDYDYNVGDYTLGIPDEEVRRDLATLLAGSAANADMVWAKETGISLLRCKWEKFFAALKALYAHMPYGSTEERTHESSYARCLAFLLAAHGFRFRTEDVQSDGRADVIAEHPCGIYIFELKVDKPLDDAIDQIKAKRYADPYRAKGLPIHAIGLTFESETRRLVGTRVEKL